ncbi:MAG TPA: SPW repeat protein, partial [Burkholderiaceae bacterium]|nr:SPW repeat protein [Burkholderiaceae bacterium]
MRWQDWISVALGLWLLMSPWALGFSSFEAATWNAALFGIAIVVLEFADVLVPDPWPDRVSLPVALWVAISPLILGFTDQTAAAVSTALTGVAVVLLDAWTLWAERR